VQLGLGDTFTAPEGAYERFPGREMRVTALLGHGWIDAEPVKERESDLYLHCTYDIERIGENRPLEGNNVIDADLNLVASAFAAKSEEFRFDIASVQRLGAKEHVEA
jgi:hypothetical protein